MIHRCIQFVRCSMSTWEGHFWSFKSASFYKWMKHELINVIRLLSWEWQVATGRRKWAICKNEITSWQNFHLSSKTIITGTPRYSMSADKPWERLISWQQLTTMRCFIEGHKGQRSEIQLQNMSLNTLKEGQRQFLNSLSLCLSASQCFHCTKRLVIPL